jgi:separase
MHPALCSILNVETDPHGPFVFFRCPPSFPTNPVVLYQHISYMLSSSMLAHNQRPCNNSELTHFHCATLPTKHMDSLLSRAYTSLTKLTSSPSPNPKLHLKSTPAINASHESIFILRMYALRCLIHTSPGTIETNMFWDQVVRFTSSFVKSTASDVTLEERCTTTVLFAYADIVERGEKRPDRDTFMAIDQKGKGFLNFCEYWMEFTKRVRRLFVFLDYVSSICF